jgi:transposase-like protein
VRQCALADASMVDRIGTRGIMSQPPLVKFYIEIKGLYLTRCDARRVAGSLPAGVMTEHFLLSAAARSLSAAKIMRMSDSGVENVFLRLRWPATDGKPVCPGCGCMACYACPRPTGQQRWRCKACRSDFSITSGTLFAWHKLPLRTYLLAVAFFCNEVKGKSMLALSRELDVQYKTALVLAHKLREAMASSMKVAHRR